LRRSNSHGIGNLKYHDLKKSYLNSPTPQLLNKKIDVAIALFNVMGNAIAFLKFIKKLLAMSFRGLRPPSKLLILMVFKSVVGYKPIRCHLGKTQMFKRPVPLIANNFRV
jgi:hypothetical protein